ncbi:hypothetical protein [Massilia haematophila]|uniref:Lipoprotein n=1 Tax=Massilia haematophila TaxID=457923 RepID=A0ABV7PDT7_9BURK
MEFARNAEIWIFGAFIVLGAAACLSGPAERAAPAPTARTLPDAVSNAVAEGELAQPLIDPRQPMYVVYVVGKRPTAMEKRAARKSGAG